MKTHIISRLLALPLLGLLAASPGPAQTPPDANPALAPVQALSLHEGFTLTYTVVESDVRSPALRAARMAGVERDYRAMVVRGQCTQAQADGMIKTIEGHDGMPQPPKRYGVTLSARGGRLLCISRESAGREFAADQQGAAHALPLETEVVLYDGHKTYDYSSQTPSMTIMEGWRGMRLALLPGVGLPGLPLAKPPDGITPARQVDGDGLACAVFEAPWSNPTPPGTVYLPGKVQTTGSGGALRVIRVTTTDGSGQPFQEWRYDRPQRFGGVWLARRVHFREDQTGADGIPAPARAMEYSVSRAVPHALPAAAFDIRTFLPPGTGIYEGQAYHFRFDPHGGDLETQRRVQTARQAADARKRALLDSEMRADRSDHGDGSDAGALLTAARARAAAEGKNVLLVFRACWCGPCFLLHHFLDDPQAGPLIRAHYVVVEEDIWEREKNGWENPGGPALFHQYGGRHAIPFYAVLTPGGKKLGDSISGNETMGMPGSAAEEKFFLGLFRKTAPGLTPVDMAALKAGLERNTVIR